MFECTLCSKNMRSEVLRIRHELECAGAGATWECEGCGTAIPDYGMIDTHRATCTRPRIRAVPRAKTLLEEAGILNDEAVTF